MSYSRTNSGKGKSAASSSISASSDGLITDDTLVNLDEIDGDIKSVPEKKSKTKVITGGECKLEDVVIQSTLKSKSAAEQAIEILDKFNDGITADKSCFVESPVRGEQIHPGTFMLGRHNTTPELHLPSREPIARVLMPFSIGKQAEIIGIVNQSDEFYGSDGSYVLNVKAGSYARAFSGNTPLLYGEGCHVIRDQNFKYGHRDGLGLVSQSEPYIQHGTIHILRVPAGSIALASVGSENYILEARKEPYVFNNGLFKLIPNNNSYFHDATTRLIKHGSIKRIMPHTGEVGITYDCGALKIIPAGKLEKIDSPNVEVTGFLPVGIRTMILPNVKAANRAAGQLEEFKILRTSDSLKVGVKLLVAFEIFDPEKALNRLLDEKGILEHIEGLAITDMTKAVQRCTSLEFLSSHKNKPQKVLPELLTDQKEITYQDEVKARLDEDLSEYGIKIIRFQIEEAKIMDEKIALEMESQAIQTAQATGKEAILEKNFAISKREAEQAAERKRIEQQQINDATESAAIAKLKAAAKEADIVILRAQAEKKALDLRGEAYKATPELFERDMATIIAGSLKDANMSITSSEFASVFNSPFAMFGSAAARSKQPDAAKKANAPGQLIQLEKPSAATAMMK